MAAEHCSLTFEELYKLLIAKGLCNHAIGLLLGIPPNRPSRYLGPQASGLPIQTIESVHRHLTCKGKPILLMYSSVEKLKADMKQFIMLIGDNKSRRGLGWYKGSENFTLEVCDV